MRSISLMEKPAMLCACDGRDGYWIAERALRSLAAGEPGFGSSMAWQSTLRSRLLYYINREVFIALS